MNIDLQQVANFAKWVHRGQMRKYTGDPYHNHIARVAAMTMLLKEPSTVMVAAAWCHDTVEDHPDRCDFDLLEGLFGYDVRVIVEDLTNVSKVQHPESNREARKKMDHQRLKAVDPSTLKIKLLDRTDNICEIPPESDFAITYTKETAELIEVLAPHNLAGTDAEYHALHDRLIIKTAELKSAAEQFRRK